MFSNKVEAITTCEQPHAALNVKKFELLKKADITKQDIKAA